MANVDAEHNAAPSEQAVETESESITLSEENLEALLRGVKGAVPAPKPNAAQAANVRSGSPEQVAKAEPARGPEPFASLASLQEASPVEAVPPPPFEVSPAAVAPMQASQSAAPQPDVNSKLALISAIKQRRAVTPRSEPPAVEHEASAPRTASLEQEQHAQAVTEQQEAALAKTVAEKERASQPEGERAGPVPVLNAPVARAANGTPEVQQQKASLPAKKVWTTNSLATPGEPQRTPAPRPELAKVPAPRATVAAPPVEAPDTPETEELFATFGSGVPQQEVPKPKNFITSKAGMGVIGGAIAAAALTVYFLTAHTSKKETVATNAPLSAPVQVAEVTPATSSSDAKNATAASAAPATQHAPVPVSTQVPTARPVATSPTGVTQQIPQQNGIPQNIPAQQTATPETPRTVARAFTAPTSARPTSSPVVEAAPNLAISSTTPAAVGLPARIAPLPPPPVPATPTPAANTQPKQLNVAGSVQAARITHQVVPAYPAVARAARVQGTVRFRAVIGADGAVKSLTTLGGPLPLAQAASEAVKQWRYQPTVVDGKPVEVTTQIDVAFTL